MSMFPRLAPGITVVTSTAVPGPRPPTPGEDGVRLVRHGMADVLEWLGEKPGPKPGEPVHTMFVIGNQAFMRPEYAAKIVGSFA